MVLEAAQVVAEKDNTSQTFGCDDENLEKVTRRKCVSGKIYPIMNWW